MTYLRLQDAAGQHFEPWHVAGYRFKCSVCNYILRDQTEWRRHITQARYPDCRFRPPQRGPSRHRAARRQLPVEADADDELRPVRRRIIQQNADSIQPAAVSLTSVAAPRKRTHVCDCQLCGICPGEQRFTLITCDHTLCTSCADGLFTAELRHISDPCRRPRCPICNEAIQDIDLRRLLPEHVRFCSL